MDHITIMLCCDATGDGLIRLLMVARLKWSNRFLFHLPVLKKSHLQFLRLKYYVVRTLRLSKHFFEERG